MMRSFLALVALFASPFWETTPPEQWTDAQLQTLLRESPWAQMVEAPLLQAYIASARPMQQAEEELARRQKRKPDPLEEDYRDFLRADKGKHLVLAIATPNWNALSEGEESRRMLQETLMKVGKRKYKLTGHFAPTPSDPYLRLIFPRELRPEDKAIAFEVYVPGITNPWRQFEFRVQDLAYRGKPEM